MVTLPKCGCGSLGAEINESAEKGLPSKMVTLPKCAFRSLDVLRSDEYFSIVFGGIAQLVERLVRNEKVRGSNPLTSTRG